MAEPIIVVGAGGFGRETLDAILAVNDAHEPTWEVLGVVDDQPSAIDLLRLRDMGFEYLGKVSHLPALSAYAAIAVGSPRARARIARELSVTGVQFPHIVHPTAIVGTGFRHGAGLIMLGGSTIGVNVSLGDHVHLNGHTVIGHDVELGDYVSVNPNGTVSGDVRVGNGTLVGASSVILQGLTIGERSIVGAGACVTRDVPDDATVKGVPAK